jgi:predicted phosphodiesterase
MLHIGGHPGRYAAGVRDWLVAERPDLFICGHSHILRVERDAHWGGMCINPGAAGVHGFHRMRTLLRMEVDSGSIQSMEAVELGLRGKIL